MDTSVYAILCCIVLVRDASGSCGTVTIMKPTFVNRNVTLKFIPRNQRITNIIWKYTSWWDETKEHAVEGLKGRFPDTVQDGSHYHTMLFFADRFYNNSKFHVCCRNLNDVTRSNIVKIHLHEIINKCGNLMLLSPEIKYGENVQIEFYPSDTTLADENNELTMCRWFGQPLHIREDIFEGRKISAYLYILTIYNFTENKAEDYALKCNRPKEFITNWLNINVTDSQLIGPIWDDCVYGNSDTTIYCNTSRTRGKTYVSLSIGNKGVTIVANEIERGVYTVVLDSNTWRDHDGYVVTCSVSNVNYIHDLKSSAKLCYIDKGSDHILNMPEYIHNENRQIRTSFRQELTSVSGDNSKRPFEVPFEPILIGTGAFVALCLFVASARTLVRWHKGRKRTRDPDNTEVTPSPIEASPSLESNGYVDMPETSMHMNASHDLEDDYVELNTQTDSMIVRKPNTANKSKHAESNLMYVDLDIDHLQQACAGPIPGPRPTRGNVVTVYEDIDFSNTKPHEVL